MDGLRDYTFSSWSRVAGVPASAELDALYNESRKLSQSAPRLHSKHEVQESAQHADGSKKLTKLCQKPPQERTEEDINYVQEQVSRLAPFFRLWPEALQHELARALQTEVLVRHECVMARASQPTKLFFILEGKLSVRVPQLPSSTSSSAAPPPPLTPPLSPRHPPSLFLPTPPSPLSPASPFSQTSSGGRDRKGSRPGPLLGPAPPSAATSPGAGAQHYRTMATLKRGDACGEAALLGGASSQADVVVVSEGAVLLSLTRTDFLHAFKAILGLRQQDRLLYLRCHPLFAGVALGELDLLSDALHVAVYPPGACMLPLRPGTAPRLLLLAEGIATVRRSRGGRGGGPALSASRRAALEEGSMPVAYDCDTVSVLQPLDLLGSNLLPGQVVEADTQVKAYWLTADQLPALPPGLQALLSGAQTFKSAYFAGRLAGLQQQDQARRAPGYGAATYPGPGAAAAGGVGAPAADLQAEGDLNHTSRPQAAMQSPLASPSPSPSPFSSPDQSAAAGGAAAGAGGGPAGGGSAAGAAAAAAGGGVSSPSRMATLLQGMSLQQSIQALDVNPVRDRHTGLPLPSATAHSWALTSGSHFLTHGPPSLTPPAPLPLHAARGKRGQEGGGSDHTGNHLDHTSARAGSHPRAEGGGWSNKQQTGWGGGAPWGSGGPNGGGGGGWHLIQRHKGLQILGRSDRPSHWSDQADNECDPDPKAHHHATTLAHTAVLGSLPPGMTALARIDNRRNHHRYAIQTEVPSQPLQPVSCVQRHMELFQQSLHAAMQRWPSRRPQYGYTTEVGEEEGTGRGGSGEGGLGGWPGAAWTQEQRQPSRRLSGDPRSRQCRDSSGGGSRNKRSGGRAGPGAGDGGQSGGGGRAEGIPARPPHQQSAAQQQHVYTGRQGSDGAGGVGPAAAGRAQGAVADRRGNDSGEEVGWGGSSRGGGGGGGYPTRPASASRQGGQGGSMNTSTGLGNGGLKKGEEAGAGGGGGGGEGAWLPSPPLSPVLPGLGQEQLGATLRSPRAFNCPPSQAPLLLTTMALPLGNLSPSSHPSHAAQQQQLNPPGQQEGASPAPDSRTSPRGEHGRAATGEVARAASSSAGSGGDGGATGSQRQASPGLAPAARRGSMTADALQSSPDALAHRDVPLNGEGRDGAGSSPSKASVPRSGKPPTGRRNAGPLHTSPKDKMLANSSTGTTYGGTEHGGNGGVSGALASTRSHVVPVVEAGMVQLPPAVLLGYEMLDPFQWAAYMSYSNPDARRMHGQGSQDAILPRPKW